MQVLEIRWHGRGGQGVVTAAKFLTDLALEQGQYFQAFPEYGPERMGAPIQAFTRMSPEPIRIRCGVSHPEAVVVLDPTLLSTVNVADGLESDGVLVVNTSQDPADLKTKVNLVGTGATVWTVNATQIAVESIGRPIPNTPMVGALVRALDLADIDMVAGFLRASFGKKFSDEIAEGNVQALVRAFEEVKQA